MELRRINNNDIQTHLIDQLQKLIIAKNTKSELTPDEKASLEASIELLNTSYIDEERVLLEEQMTVLQNMKNSIPKDNRYNQSYVDKQLRTLYNSLALILIHREKRRKYFVLMQEEMQLSEYEKRFNERHGIVPVADRIEQLQQTLTRPTEVRGLTFERLNSEARRMTTAVKMLYQIIKNASKLG